MRKKNGLMEYFSIIFKKRFITGTFRSLQAHLSEWCTARLMFFCTSVYF